MATANRLVCTKHGLKVVAGPYLIAHQFVVELCDSQSFYDDTNIYDRKGVKTGTPVPIDPPTSLDSLSIIKYMHKHNTTHI